MTAGKPLRFEPFNGRIPCCDMGYPELRFLQGQSVEIFAAGYAGELETVQYTIQKDGRIALDPGDNNDLVLWLRGKDLHDMFAYQCGSDIYLVRDTESAPDFFLEQNAFWPFKYVAD